MLQKVAIVVDNFCGNSTHIRASKDWMPFEDQPTNFDQSLVSARWDIFNTAKTLQKRCGILHQMKFTDKFSALPRIRR